jgi:hypothetical protein
MPGYVSALTTGDSRNVVPGSVVYANFASFLARGRIELLSAQAPRQDENSLAGCASRSNPSRMSTGARRCAPSAVMYRRISTSNYPGLATVRCAQTTREGPMRLGRCVPSFVAAVALAVVAGACVPEDSRGIGGKGGASGATGNGGGGGGPAGSSGGNVGPGGSAGSVTGSGGETGLAGTSGGGGTTGSAPRARREPGAPARPGEGAPARAVLFQAEAVAPVSQVRGAVAARAARRVAAQRVAEARAPRCGALDAARRRR